MTTPWLLACEQVKKIFAVQHDRDDSRLNVAAKISQEQHTAEGQEVSPISYLPITDFVILSEPDPISKSRRFYLVDKFVHKPLRIAKRFHLYGIKFKVTRFAHELFGSARVLALSCACARAETYGINASFGK